MRVRVENKTGHPIDTQLFDENGQPFKYCSAIRWGHEARDGYPVATLELPLIEMDVKCEVQDIHLHFYVPKEFEAGVELERDLSTLVNDYIKYRTRKGAATG